MAILENYIADVRRVINEKSLTEDVVSDADILLNFASTVSDDDITERLKDGVNYVLSRVQADVIPSFIIDVFPSDLDIPYVSTKKIIRFLSDTAQLSDGTVAVRRTKKTHRRLSEPITDETPVYILEDFDLKIYGDTENPVGSKIKAVKVSTSSSDIVGLGLQFKNILVNYAAASCLETAKEFGLSRILREAVTREISKYIIPSLIPSSE